jgi:hypothetical protein
MDQTKRKHFNGRAFRLGVNVIVGTRILRRRRNEISYLNNSKTIRRRIFKFHNKTDHNTLHLLYHSRSQWVTLTPQNWGTKSTQLNCSQTVRATIFKFHIKIKLNTLHLLSPLSTLGGQPNPPKLGDKNYPIKLQPNRNR